MRIGAFDIEEPGPDLREPHAIAMLRPWIDVGSVGSLVTSRLETHFRATELARLAKPGNFFDFTRYRPVLYIGEGHRQIAVPNTFVTYAKRDTGSDLIFLHLLEPHMLSELYVDSVLLLLKRFNVKRYCLIGSMYDYVPHTRPLLVSGRATGRSAEDALQTAGVQPSDYEGPTTITYFISQRAAEWGTETMSVIVHLPQYSQLDEDYTGVVRLLEVLGSLYGVPVESADISRAERQRKDIDLVVDENIEVRKIVAQLEAHYDARVEAIREGKIHRLSPEVEKFLSDMEKRFRMG